MTPPLVFSSEVATARAVGRPIVALETTVVTHGLPAPENLATACAVEADIRAEGAVPATIAVLDGAIRIGLTPDELKRLALMPDAAKLSRADLAIAIAEGRPGSTTVAATLICARLAGISVFATGGIGGVHRGAEHTFDVSADLRELAESPLTVVASGAKAILDIPKTLEVLETFGVPVIAFGQDDFPGFWSRSSGLRAPLRLDDPIAIARAHLMRRSLALSGGQLVANPIPEADEIPFARLAPFIEAALAEATARSITAKAVTPFLLSHIVEATAGASTRANIALLRSNARLAARIARRILDLDQERAAPPVSL